MFRLIAFSLLSLAFPTQGASTISLVNRYAHGANIGWLDWRGDGANGASVSDYVCSGYVYAANVGWISLGSGAPASGIRYQNNSSSDFGVNHDGFGGLSGLAWGSNIGWLVFTNRDSSGSALDGPRVDLRTGRFRGWVWSGNCGWISLSNAFAFVQTDSILTGNDSDGDGLPDAWELSYVGNLTVMNGSSNSDGDAATDRQEFEADTNPLLAGDTLRITAFSFAPYGTNALVTWSSRPTRNYFVHKRSEFDSDTSWSDAGPGLIFPDAGPTTSRVLLDAPSPQRFLRIEAVRALAP
jgi:hypothetical protein